jgi:hypothetical protein
LNKFLSNRRQSVGEYFVATEPPLKNRYTWVFVPLFPERKPGFYVIATRMLLLYVLGFEGSFHSFWTYVNFNNGVSTAEFI